VAIAELHIQHLGGIPRELDLTFTKDGRAASVVLYGDNGTGKSSVVDAIEFALQARVRRAGRPQEVLKAVRPLATAQLPMIRADLDSGEIVERGFADEPPDGVSIVPPEPHPAFRIAPVALRRQDVTGFWDTPEDQRQVLFRAFFQDPEQGSWIRLDEGEERRLNERRSRLKTRRRKLLDVLLEPLDAISSQVPLESPEAFDAFIEHSFPETFGRNWPRSGPAADNEQDTARFEAAVEVRRVTHEILDVQQKLRKAKAAGVGQTALADVLTSATAELGTAFNEISDVSFVDAVDLRAGEPGEISLKVRVRTSNGRVVRPEDVLSEANLDLLALLVFTSIAKAAAEQGQDRVLLLDDVVQSVDTPIRTRLLEYLAIHFADWQLVITTHDRMWREIVFDTLESQRVAAVGLDITGWSYLTGPAVRGYLGGKVERLRRRIASGDDATDICAAAGVTLEEVCQQLSWRLPVEVVRDKRDQYMLGALWPPVAARMREMGGGDLVAAVDRSRKLRNLVGAHYVEWAQSLSDAEARDFGNAVVAFVDAVKCPQCGGWIRRKGAGYACGCGATRLPPAP
jgi:hypothetical protein